MIVEEADLARATSSAAPFKASRFVVKPGQTSELDQHAVKECWFVANGEGRLVYAGETEVTVKAGDMLFYESFHSHQVTNTGADSLLIFAVWWR